MRASARRSVLRALALAGALAPVTVLGAGCSDSGPRSAGTAEPASGSTGSPDPGSGSSGTLPGGGPLRLGLLLGGDPSSPPAMRLLRTAAQEAVLDVHRAGGVLGADVELHVQELAAGEDPASAVAALVASGCTAAIPALAEEDLLRALAPMAEAGWAICAPLSDSARLRADDDDAGTDDRGLLIRLQPPSALLARALALEALEAAVPAESGGSGTIAVLADGGMAAQDLSRALAEIAPTIGAAVILSGDLPGGGEAEAAVLASAILAASPALLVLEGEGERAAAVLTALGGQLGQGARAQGPGPAVRLGPAATASLPIASVPALDPAVLERVIGLQGGAEISEDFRLMMLTADPSLLEHGAAGLAGATQTYDAVVLLALAAQLAASTRGAAIAAALPAVIEGGEDCAGAACLELIRTAQAARQLAEPRCALASGELVLQEGDPAGAAVRRFRWSADGRAQLERTVRLGEV